MRNNQGTRVHESAEHCIEVQNIWSRFGHTAKKDPPLLQYKT